MNDSLKRAFDQEINRAKVLFNAAEYEQSFKHLERAHILGQRHYVPHVKSHWWMLKVGFKQIDKREVFGQILRIIASVGSLIGWVPVGNTGGANVNPMKAMPIPQDLAPFLIDEKLPSVFKVLTRTCLLLLFLFLAVLCYWHITHIRGVQAADSDWKATKTEPLNGIGTTNSLSIIPLINWHTSDQKLKTEAGVSYLIQTDKLTLLFDLGFNFEGLMPSPLSQNMKSLGIEDNDIDAIFLSHLHPDHSGDLRSSTKSGSLNQRWLSKPIFTPAPLSNIHGNVKLVKSPQIIGPAIASIGPIRRKLALGVIEEWTCHGIVPLQVLI